MDHQRELSERAKTYFVAFFGGAGVDGNKRTDGWMVLGCCWVQAFVCPLYGAVVFLL